MNLFHVDQFIHIEEVHIEYGPQTIRRVLSGNFPVLQLV